MSEVLTIGIAAGAVGACVAVVGAVAVVGYATYRALSWLSEQGQREMERLDKMLAIPMPTHTTPNEALQEFHKNLTDIKAQVAENPFLKTHGDTVSRVLALHRSPLKSFVGEAQWKQMCGTKVSSKAFNAILKQAARNFTQANATYIARSISEAAVKAGFVNTRTNRQQDGSRVMVMEDDQGRALIADVIEADDGARVNMDLTGFGDGTCHEVMDRVLKGLAEKDIRLGEVRRRSHYCRDGVIASALGSTRRKSKPVARVYPDEERRQSKMRRKRYHHYGTDRAKLKA